MNTKSSLRVRLLTFALLLAAALLVVKAAAADPPIPIVHILATDPCAAEAGAAPATLTVVRNGPTNAPLTVYYSVAGSAQNGVDYQLLSGSVTIPACASSAPITITPIDDSLVEGDEVVFALSKPFNFLLDRLATSFLSIVPSGTPDSGSPPPGTGAYALASFDQAGQKVILRRYTESWVVASPDAPKAIEIRGIPSEALGAAELRSGGIDMAEFHSSALNIMQAQSQGSYRITEYDHSELRLIALNQTRAPFNGPQGPSVGQALNLGIDRAALIKRLGGGQPFGGPVPAPGFASKQFGFDRSKAQSLVAQLAPDARKLELLVEPVDEARIIAELLVAQWQEIGLRVTPVYGRADFFPKAAGGEFQMALAYYGPYVPSAEQYLWMYRKGAIPIPNVMRFDDTAYRILGSNLIGLTRERDWLLDSASYGERSTGSARLPGALLRQLALTL